jgi:hypothetical protein
LNVTSGSWSGSATTSNNGKNPYPDGLLHCHSFIIIFRTDDEFRVVAYQDFVSDYIDASVGGGKLVNLCLTVVYRDRDGLLKRRYIDNLCSDEKHNSADAFFVRSVWERHLGQSGEFNGVTHILRTGDSGAHFHNRAMFGFESMVSSLA